MFWHFGIPLSIIPYLWAQSPSETPCLYQLVKSVALNVSLLNRLSAPVDLSNFLRGLECKISSIQGTPFNFNTQQDVPEILRVLLDDFKGLSPLAEAILSTTLQSTVTCDTCFCSSVKEDKFDMLTLSTMKHISASLNHLLQSQCLSGDNMWYCPQCSSNQNATTDSIITKCDSVLILHLKRSDSFLGNHVLEIPIEQNYSVSFSNIVRATMFSLKLQCAQSCYKQS